jgi:hypothetical protein
MADWVINKRPAARVMLPASAIVAKLSDSMLNDISIDRETAMVEAKHTSIPASRMAYISC